MEKGHQSQDCWWGVFIITNSTGAKMGMFIACTNQKLLLVSRVKANN